MSSQLPQAYLFPGLALNPEVLGQIELLEYNVNYIRWIDPTPQESMIAYAKRITQIYSISEEQPLLFIGHSFGGLLAQVMASFFPKAKLVLISTVKQSSELPWKIRFLRHGYAYHLASKTMIQKTLSLWGWYHGYDQPELQEALLSETNTLDNEYFIWAYKNIIHWSGVVLENPMIHIHGDSDRTFPIDNISNCISIPGGDHLMVYKRAKEINLLIADFLNSFEK